MGSDPKYSAFSVSSELAPTFMEMCIRDSNTSSADNYIDGSETGCFNMYEWLNENGYGSLDAKMIKDIVIAASREVDTTINYLFFGPAPTTETEPSETEPTETEPSETEPSQTCLLYTSRCV